MKRIFTTTLRLDMTDEEDRRAWSYLQRMDKKQYRSYSRAIVAAVNDYFGRQEQLAADPYLETREKEDAFLQRSAVCTCANGSSAAVHAHADRTGTSRRRSVHGAGLRRQLLIPALPLIGIAAIPVRAAPDTSSSTDQQRNTNPAAIWYHHGTGWPLF